MRGTSQLLFGGMGRLTESSVLSVKNRSHAITAGVTVPDAGPEGVIVAQGGAFAGWSLLARNGRLKYVHNVLRLHRFGVEGDSDLPARTHQVRMELAYDGGGLGKGGTVTLYVDGEAVGTGRVEATVPLVYSADETLDVGVDTASPVTDEFTAEESRFTGTVHWVQIDVDEAAEDVDHLITPEERFRIATARQ